MLDDAQVVIVGGGIVGCSVAYHLTRMGRRDVAVIEKGELTSGSTWHAAGLVGQLRSHRNVTRMLKYSVELYASLQEETGINTGWSARGCLHLACSNERMLELKRGATVARSFGLNMHLITPSEAQKLFPVISLDGVVGAAFMPTDGQADPSGLTLALARGATQRGAKILQNTRVTGFDVKGDRITAVHTDKGSIRCEVAVNAAGMWSGEIGALAGVNVPVVPFQHQYLVTEPIADLPRNLPTLRDKDSLIYYKDEVGGLVMGGYEHDGIPWAEKGIPAQFSQELLEPDLDHFQPLLEAAIRRTPCLETAEISRLINGPEAFTPDGNCILGPAPEMENMFVAAGFNAFGIAAGGGAGKALAEWIVEGAPSLDLWPLDIRRFGPHHRSRRYNVERTREIYGKHYGIAWPFEEHTSARRIRRSPLYERLKAEGAVYGAKFGWERANWFAPQGVDPHDEHTFSLPNWFEHVGREHRAAREGAVLIDQSSFNKFQVEGPGALKALNRLAANNLDRPPGSVIYTQCCNARGGIECDLTVARLTEERFFLVTGTAFGVRDATWIRKHLPDDGSVHFQEVTSAYAMLNLIGPRSRAILVQVTDDDLSQGAFPYLACRFITLGSAPVLAMRVTYVGELGYELYVPAEFALHVYELVREAGRGAGLRPAGYRAIESLRLEKGYRAWGAELSPDYTPYDAGLGFCVDLAKGEFLGRSALAEIHARGSRWKLCCFALQSEHPRLLLGGEPICRQDKVLGVVTSGGYGYTVGRTIAYGYLEREAVRAETGFEIEVLKESLPAVRYEGPLYDPQGEKLRGG